MTASVTVTVQVEPGDLAIGLARGRPFLANPLSDRQAERMLEAAIAILVLLAALWFVANLIGLGFWILWTLLAGLIVGGLARVILRGRTRLSWFSTALYGVAGSFLGRLGGRLLDFGTVLTFVLSVGIAAILIYFMHLQKQA